MSDKRDGHDIDFFRGNISKDQLDKPKIKNIEDSYTYSDFKFNKRKKPEEVLRKEQSYYREPNYNDIPRRQEPIRQEPIRQQPISDDPNIASGRRKPLKQEYISEASNYQMPRKEKKRRKKRKFRGKKIIISILLALLLMLIALFAFLVFIKNTASPVNFVVIGVDQREGQADTEIRADAIMNVNASTKSNEILMASIPRDTYTYIPCEEQSDKITHAYIYGATNWPDKGGGKACTVQAASSLLNISMDKYAKVNFDNMIGIIDAIGGIDLKSTATFCEQNSKGKKNSYCYEKGTEYHMDGEMALAYSRHRKTDNDIERGLRQQEVFKAVFAKVKNTKIWQWPGLYTKVSTMIDTNLSHKEMLQIAIIYATKGNMKNYKFKWNGVYYNGVSYVELQETSVKKYTSKVNALE